MAHALMDHDGPCRNIHGHTYHLHVTIMGAPRTEKGHPKDGMVVDFSNLKEIVNREVISEFDHALVLNEETKGIGMLTLNGFEKLIRVPFQPTCENLLLDFKKRLAHFFDAHHQLVSLKLEETPTSFAEWRVEDN